MAIQTNELVTHQKPAVLQAIEAAKPQFEGRLPGGMTVDRFILGLATAVQKNPALLDCESKSVLLAGYEAAELGVNLSPTLGLGFIIPYGKLAQFQLSYRGMVQMAYKTGVITSFFAEVVYANDKFERQLAPKRNIFHAPADGDRGEAIGVYALVELKDGNLEYEYLTKEQVERHHRHSKAPDSLMWKAFWEEGWRKTPIRVLSKRLPLTNAGMEKLAEAIAKDATDDLDEPTGALHLEKDSPLLTLPKNSDAAILAGRSADLFVQIDKQFTVITGNTYLLKDDLPKVGAKWDGKARVWTMPAARTHELMAACEAKNVNVVEVDANGKPLGPDGVSVAAAMKRKREPGEEPESLFDA